MATAAIGKEVEKHLECGICLERFCLQGPKEPKMLPCQHTYCKECLGRLVTRAGPEDYKVTCPECKRETKIPGGDVTRLQPNFLIKRLLSIREAGQSEVSSLCEKHEGEEIKVFCETCDRSICRDCAIKEHRDHKYSFIEDVFPAEKEKIINSVRKVKTSILTLKSAIQSIQMRERKVEESSMTISQEVATFIDQNVALQDSKTKSLKQDLERQTRTQMKQLSDQKEALLFSLACAESGVEFAEQVLAKRREVEILSMKNQIIQQMTELNAAAEAPKQNIVYKFESNSPPDDESVGKITKKDGHRSEHTALASRAARAIQNMRKHGSEDDEFVLSMLGGEPGVIYITRAEQTCHFVISPKNKNKAAGGRKDEVEVFIDERKHVAKRNQDGTYSFSYRPMLTGIYHIRISINGSWMCVSPWRWEVKPAFSFSLSSTLRSAGTLLYPRESIFQTGQHSWKTQFLLSRTKTGKIHQIGVIHANGKFKSYWEEGRRVLIGRYCEKSSSTSTVRDFQHEDVFVCYLDTYRGQLIIYNERTKQSDIFSNLKAAVSPLIFPEECDYFNFAF